MNRRPARKPKPKKTDLLADQLKLYHCQPKVGPIYETFAKKCSYEPATTTRSDYLDPPCHNLDLKDLAKRRELFRKNVMKEMMEEIEREENISPPIEPYCSTYDDMFRIPGFKVKDLVPEDDEMFLKYPLYSSEPITYYSDVINKYSKDSCKVQGMTKMQDSNMPFKRSYAFSKPLDERLDNPEG